MYWLDILIILGIGAFVASRFFGYRLPKDNTPKDSRHGWQELLDKLQPPNPHEPAERRTGGIPPETRPEKAPKQPKASKVAAGPLAPLQAADPSFDEASFLEGAAAAYHYFYERLNALDAEGLDNLCGPQLMAELELQLEGYRESDTTPNVQVRDVTPRITATRVTGRTAIVTVQFTALQAEGPATGGKPTAARTLKQTWVFARAVGSADPNWELQSITPGQADA